MVYLDDIIIFSKTNEDHINNLNRVFEFLNNAILRVKLSKCKFLVNSVPYQGHTISANGIASDLTIIDALANYRKP